MSAEWPRSKILPGTTCGHCGEAGHSMIEYTKNVRRQNVRHVPALKLNKQKTGDNDCLARKDTEYRYVIKG